MMMKSQVLNTDSKMTAKGFCPPRGKSLLACKLTRHSNIHHANVMIIMVWQGNNLQLQLQILAEEERPDSRQPAVSISNTS